MKRQRGADSKPTSQHLYDKSVKTKKEVNVSGIKTPQLPLLTPVILERSRQNYRQPQSKSLNTSYDQSQTTQMMKNKAQTQNKMSQILGNVGESRVKTDRGQSLNNQPTVQREHSQNFGNTYFGDSFQLQKQTLQNLIKEPEDDFLRDVQPPQPHDAMEGPPPPQPHSFDGDCNPFYKEETCEQEEISPINQNPIDNLDFEVQIKSIVKRIKDYTVQIKDKVKVHRQLSESFMNQTVLHHDEDDNFDDPHHQSFLPIGDGDISVILQKPINPNDKSDFNDNSYLMNHATGQFGDNTDSLLLSPKFDEEDDASLIFKDQLNGDVSNTTNNINIADDTKKDDKLVIEKETLQNIVRDLQSKHQAEKDALLCEIAIFKKVIHFMGAKLRDLQDDILDRDRLQLELYKKQHMYNRLEVQFKKVRDENRKLNQKLEIMRSVMLEFDHQYIEERTADDYLIDQLIKENHNLQRLLLISESHGLKDYTSIEEQLKALEERTVNILNQTDNQRESLSMRRASQLSYFNKKKNEIGNSPFKENQIPEPLHQSMPPEVKQMVIERQMIKEEERRINLEMRRLAEEEIMRELKLAEELYATSEFSRTSRKLTLYSGNEDYEDISDEEEECDFERDGNHTATNQEESDSQCQQKGNNEDEKSDQVKEKNQINESCGEQIVAEQKDEKDVTYERSIEDENKVGNEQR